MKHIMFDIDGTLINSYTIDSQCYIDAIKNVLNINFHDDWSRFEHTTDSGILNELLSIHPTSYDHNYIHTQVKHAFIQNIKSALNNKPMIPLRGAVEFVQKLALDPDISISIATGGWKESALLKLESAGFNVSNIAMASANDHFSRTEIMKLALLRSGAHKESDVTYFGDGEWDKKACEELGFQFTLVGDRLNHTRSIQHFENLELTALF